MELITLQTIHTYIEEYGKYTFLEKEFNDVDNVILSLISYIDLKDIVPTFKEGSILLKDASKIYSIKNTNNLIQLIKCKIIKLI